MKWTHALWLPLVSSLVAADQQQVLKEQASGWLDKVKQYIPLGASNPVDAAAAVIADGKVETLTIRNWEGKLSPKLDREEEWMVFVTGGNKSCYGRCGKVDTAWTEAVPLLAALPEPAGAPSLRLGLLDCEKEVVLCTAWAASLPSIYHFLLPVKPAEGPSPLSPLHVIPLNISTTGPSDIVSIPSTSASRYLKYNEYTGWLHPLDGWMANYRVLIPFGYVMWGFGSTPSWLMMVGISFVSRQIMSKRLSQTQGVPTGMGQPAQQAQTPSRPAPAAAPKSGGGKKRR